jgi:hypothetical protein
VVPPVGQLVDADEREVVQRVVATVAVVSVSA